jgi:hypothetical protein
MSNKDLFSSNKSDLRLNHSISLYKELINSSKDIREDFLKNVNKFPNQLLFNNLNAECLEKMYFNILPEDSIPTMQELEKQIEGLRDINKEAYKFFMKKRNDSIKGLDVQLGNKFDDALIAFLKSKKVNASRADIRNKRLPDIQILDKSKNIKAYIEHKYHHAPFLLSWKLIGRESYEGSITMDLRKVERQIIECESELPNRPVYFVHWVDFHHLKGVFFNTLGQIKDYLELGQEFERKEKKGDYKLSKKVGYTEKFYPPLHEMGDFSELLEQLSNE